MPTSPDPFDEFLRQIDPLMQSRKFPSLKKSPPLYESLEIACVAARHGDEWILVSGKAVLKPVPCAPDPQLQKVAALQEIIALEGCLPASELNDLVANLRHSWVLKQENVRLTAERARGYSWMAPAVIKSPAPKWCLRMSVIELSNCPDGFLLFNADMVWNRPFALCGNGPNPLSVLSDRTLQNIDSQLRSSTPAFNGFDGLCAYLALPIRQRNLTSSFQVLAQLPAAFSSVAFEKHALKITIECLGAPDLMVEWLPAHNLQRVPPVWISKPPPKHPTPTQYVSIGVPNYAQAAKLILAFGELQAHAGTVALPYLGMHANDCCRPLDLVEEPTVPDPATSGAPNQQEPANIATGEAPNQKDGGRKGSANPEVAKRRAIVKQCLDRGIRSPIGICQEFDRYRVPLPDGLSWEAFRRREQPWEDVFKQRPIDEERRERIRVIIAHDKDWIKRNP